MNKDNMFLKEAKRSLKDDYLMYMFKGCIEANVENKYNSSDKKIIENIKESLSDLNEALEYIKREKGY